MNEALQQAVALHRAGQLAEAERRYRAILQKTPDDADASYLLGAARMQGGDPREAAALFERAAMLRPEAAQFHIDCGKALMALNQHDAAIARIRRALALGPALADTEFTLGVALARTGARAEAAEAYRRAIALDPRHLGAHNNLGVLCLQDRQFEEAAARFRSILDVQPNHLQVVANLILALRQLNRTDEAWALRNRALTAFAGNADIFMRLGAASVEVGDYDDAIDMYRQASLLSPNSGAVFNKLGEVLMKEGRFAEAVDAYRQAETADGGTFAGNELYWALMMLGRHAEAREALRRALRSQRGGALEHRRLMVAALYSSDIDAAEAWEIRRAFGAAMEARVAAPLVSRNPGRASAGRLRIGYLSSDLRNHPVGLNMAPILENHDRRAFEIFVYADTAKADSISRKLQDHVDTWRRVDGYSEEEIARQIQADDIQVLVILAGSLDFNRPQVAAWRPAPVQVSFHDPATSGLTAMDYLLADGVLAPRGTPERFTERVVRLPSYYIREPIVGAPDVSPPPMMKGAGPTFGSFNNPCKITDATLDLWAGVLRAAPNARLHLKYTVAFRDAAVKSRIEEGLRRRGADRAQIVFREAFDDANDHLARYADIDVALDTAPFSGSTTTFEALWMGVPVVTLAGDTMVSRWTASILHAAKLDLLIAKTPEQYAAIGADLAASPTKAAELRAGMRARLLGSPLINGKAKARQIERIYRALWRKAEAGAKSGA